MYELSRALTRRHEINDLVDWFGITEVERLLEVHRTTIYRWLNGKTVVPIVAIIALRALKGEFPHMEARKTWAGWRFGRDGTLYEPNGTPHTEGEIRAIHYQHQVVAAQQAQINELTQKLEAAGVRTKVVITANDQFVDRNHPTARLLEENYQLKRRAGSRRR